MRSTITRAALATILIFTLASPALAGDLPQVTPDPTADRASIPDVYKWDITPLFADKAAWEAERVALHDEYGKLAAYQGKLGDGKALRQCLELHFALHDRTNRVTMYANMLLDGEQTNEEYQAMQQQGLSLLDANMAGSAFLRAEVLAMSDKDFDKALKKEKGLAPYTRYLGDMRRRQHTLLSEDGERVLGLLGDNLWAEIDLNEIPAVPESAFFALLSDIEWPTITTKAGEEIEVNLAAYSAVRRDPDRAVRQAGVEAFFAEFRKYQHVFAATLGGQAEFDVALARARGYDTALEAYMDKDDIDTAVYLNLIATVRANLEPLHRYVALRQQALGVDAVHLYDLYVPMVEEADSEWTFDEARETLLVALAPLGEDYIATLDGALDPANGWLDLYPSGDKGSGAFSTSVYGRHPYVKMNYLNGLRDMSTLAHEYGHAMHSHYSMQHQGYQDFRYAAFNAEIAATANEALLSDYLIANAPDDRAKAALLSDRLDSIRTTIYRQAMFAEFELEVHTFVEEGTPITASLLEETYLQLIRDYYGPDFVIGENDGMEWAFIPHFYWKYYVYTYATGLSSGIALSRLVQQGPEQRDAYLGMLQAGCSKPPLALLQDAGVDLTKPDAIEAALKLFDETLTELEATPPAL